MSMHALQDTDIQEKWTSEEMFLIEERRRELESGYGDDRLPYHLIDSQHITHIERIRDRGWVEEEMVYFEEC